MSDCEHIRHVFKNGRYTCQACGEDLGPLEHRDWSDRRAPMSFLRGGRAKMDTTFFTPSRGDVKPHYNVSLGCHVTSRADMLEKGKRRGLRPVTPDDIGTEAETYAEAERCKERAREAVANPKTSLADVYHREEVASPVGEDIR